MLTKKYNAFQRAVKKGVSPLRKKKRISESDCDAFISKVLADKCLEVPGSIYCRDGAAYVHAIDKDTFQILAFQVNSFAPGIFGPSAVKLCTPVMVTVSAHGTHRYLQHTLKDTSLSVDDFYLGRNYAGSKGPRCDREKFTRYARKLFLSEKETYSFNHHIVYRIMNANYLCHHIAEVMGYAFGALNMHWLRGQDLFFMTAGTWFIEKKHKLYMHIIDNFAGDRMSEHFQIPHYVKIADDVAKFREEFDVLTAIIDYKKTVETFSLPVGYQVTHTKKFKKSVNVITSQHILGHLLSAYYKRENVSVVTSTFQTLEYLSRAMIAKREGKTDEFGQYMRTVTSCLGYYPERNFESWLAQKEATFPAFVNEYSHAMFFRAPVLQ